ncbi:hypothetical protein QVD17_04668 [Tagetes erecta]|uniref:Uncharacterized protein n=1 Tax=Tagetes erecta TaxID=13708 RepID=A0AAD8PAV2_TARER|nr:hypothetical protein QVD17_04668 [Tagetes erecta]
MPIPQPPARTPPPANPYAPSPNSPNSSSPPAYPPTIIPPIAPSPPPCNGQGNKPPGSESDIKGCFSSCGLRCELHSNQDRCHRACMACCNRCNCVPPGQFGNKEMCGSCYTDMKTQADIRNNDYCLIINEKDLSIQII